MGKTTRWLKALFGLKSSCRDPNPSKNPQTAGFGGSGRDSGAGFCHNPATIPPNITPEEAAWLRSYYPEGKDEVEDEAERSSKHAIAVAAATAAAADAAVAAAHAAVEVVRLTSRGRNHSRSNTNNNNLLAGGDGLEGVLSWAAVKIQTNFRAYLARKALRALKGLVKIQALVRGYLVRRQATATLHGMQALIRAQATVRSKRRGPSCQPEPEPEPEPLNWARPSRRLSASFEARTLNPPIDNDTPKVVEVDVGQAGSRSARRGPGARTSYSELGEDPSSYQILPPQFQYDLQSHPQFAPARISVPNPNHNHHCCHHFHDTEWGLTAEECRSTTAHSTPRFSGPDPMGPMPPLTPTRPGPGPGIFHGGWGRQEVYYQYYPNYMAKTMSFKAKVRSQSAPKQRPDPNIGNSKGTSSGSGKKRMSLSEMMEGRNSLSGVRMQRSCSQVQEAINFKNAVMGRLGRSPL